MGKAFQLIPDSASTFALNIDLNYYYIWAIMTVFTIGIVAVVVYFSIKYRRTHKDEVGHPIHGSLMLEITWSVIPLLIALSVFVFGTAAFFSAYNPPPGAMEIYVVGKQWMWKIQHPEGNREINELHVPIGKPVRLTMTTEDVLHSFFIPAFRIKKDVVPGLYTTMWFEATKVGEYHLFCAEYCGNQHSGMIGKVHVMEPADYEAWLSGTTRGESMEAAGQRQFEKLGCATCHLEDNSGRGPSLKNVFGKPVQLQNGTSVEVDEAYIRESILTPQSKIVRTYTNVQMPTFQGQVSEDGVLQLISYVKSLSEAAAPAAAATPAVPAAAPGGKK
jgi:cytochrome c oxidase subunit II